MRILAVSLDLDDTLWPVEPAIVAAEHALDAYLREHHVAVSTRWPIAAMRDLRAHIAGEHPDLAHDFTAQRLLTLSHAFAACGEDARHVDAAFEVYHAARNRVDCYADARPALVALAARLPLVSISNGNADLERIGLHAHFAHRLSSRECGYAKPDARIFRDACARLGLAPCNVLHVGDDVHLDVNAARAAGLHAAWLNRHDVAWPDAARGARPDLEFRDLRALVEWLDARLAAQ